MIGDTGKSEVVKALQREKQLYIRFEGLIFLSLVKSLLLGRGGKGGS